jgi:molecular chaperone HtpG
MGHYMDELQLGKSNLERLASLALERPALGAFNMLAARQKLTELLSAIGTTAEFATYTKHDIGHIDALLEAADWIIPAETFAKLTVADALVLTLSIYVHDLGMLVTKAEFENRSKSDFPHFKDEVLSDESSRGVDLRDRLAALKDDETEHFLYEEFVRLHHAERVEAWVSGRNLKNFGVSEEATEIVAEVFQALDPVLRSDIALIARSHHLDDLDDLTKYKTNRSYSNAIADTANLQYAAIVLRTADLLHMTRDRTPVVQFRLASPSDPMGQREWQKQQAVRAVKPKVIQDGQSTSIEIHARFQKAEGFFALMEYIEYCEQQLKLSANWADEAAARSPHLAHYAFPWRSIDREQVEAEGFDRRQFTFQFDQEKVLELLTGHTLYNDAGVAIRELVQNAIDAVRLGQSRGIGGTPFDSNIHVSYDSSSRTLRILDHGVGMTQQTIEEHFLKVGSSGYQTKEFRENNPDFTSISRFGIGVLSAFMIADEVRVATITSDETTGRELVLKSVHGRYLIKNFDSTSSYSERIGGHGTEIELKLRASSNLPHSILSLLRRWVLLPGCTVTCVEDGGDEVRVGAISTVEALTQLLDALPDRTQKTRVIRFDRDGIEIAVAQIWNEDYKDWEFVRFGKNSNGFDDPRSRTTDAGTAISGVSVQGIRVTEKLPGFRDGGPVMLVNVSGPEAPKTNVARSDLEAGPALDALVKAVYGAVMRSIEAQVPEMAERISLRLALKEASHIYHDATTSDRAPTFTKPFLLSTVLRNAPLHPVEVDGLLAAQSSNELEKSGFSVLIGPAAEDAARFLDWLPKPKGLLTLLQDGGLLEDAQKEMRPLLGGQQALFAYGELLWDHFEPTTVRLLERGTSLLLTLEPVKERWLHLSEYSPEFVHHYQTLMNSIDQNGRNRFVNGYSPLLSRFCMDDSVAITGLEETDAVFVGRHRMFLPGTKFSLIAGRLFPRIANRSDSAIHEEMALFLTIAGWINSWTISDELQANLTSAVSAWVESTNSGDWVEKDALLELCGALQTQNTWTSTSAWQRRGDPE